MEVQVLELFLNKVALNVVKMKTAYLLHDLLTNLHSHCAESNIAPIWKYTKSIRSKLEEKFHGNISFHRSGRHVIVHSSEINLCEYSAAAIQGASLRDADHVRSFGNFIRRKAQGITKRNIDDLSPSQLVDEFSNDQPMPELYKAIYSTMYSDMQVNSHGFVKTESRNFARKIWSLAMDWESLILRSPNSKQIVLGLTTHRLPGKKGMVKYIERLGHSAPYHVILALNSKWFQNLPPSHYRFKNVTHLHSTIDNCDMKQESRFQSLQSHDTVRTLYYPLRSMDESENFFFF